MKHAAGADKHRGAHPATPLALVNSMTTMVIVALFVLTFVVQSYQIPSASMEDTLQVGDFLLVDKLVYSPAGLFRRLVPYREPRDGDVILFHHPFDPSLLLVKRVIGMPGDRIHLREGVVVRNGIELNEPYAIGRASATADRYRDNFPIGAATDERVRTEWSAQLARDVKEGDLIVPAGEYFVMGDNRAVSLDSRYWGVVPRQNIVGGPLFLYFSQDVTAGRDDKLGHEREPLSSRFKRVFHVIH